MIHVITYDLKTPNDTGADYDRVIDAIKEIYGTWCHLEKSVWLVQTNDTASQVRERLKDYFYSTDIIFVARLNGNWASRNLTTNQATWLKKRNFD